MRIRIAGVMLLCCLLLSGCAALLDREYSVIEKHTSKYWESDAGDTLRAENYQDVVNDLLLLVGEYREEATLRLYDESGDMAAADMLERAAAEVQQDTAIGAYAVAYITTEAQAQRGYYEVSIHIGYRRTEEQLKAVVNATSTAALQNLLDNAMESGRQELAVRIGYWSEEDMERVEEAAAAVQEEWDLTGVKYWAAEYYPSLDEVGLIEFRLENVPEKPPEEGDGAETDGETPGTGEVPPGEDLTAGGAGEAGEGGEGVAGGTEAAQEPSGEGNTGAENPAPEGETSAGNGEAVSASGETAPVSGEPSGAAKNASSSGVAFPQIGDGQINS